MFANRFFLLAFSCTLLWAEAAHAFGRFHALVIGNQNYKHLRPLETPLADAKAVAEVLEKQYGFTVELLPDADRDQMLKAISKLRRTMTDEQDSLLIYYAGHGFFDQQSGVDYWQPVDAAKDDDVYWVPTSRVTDLLRAISAKHVLIVADSCYSGSLLRDSGAKLPSGMSRDEWLKRMFQRRSRTALTSGGKEPVADGGGSGHSVFARAFLEVLRGNREILDGDSMFDRIKRPVVLNADQTPHYGDIKKAGQDVEEGDFLFVPKEFQEGSIREPPESKTNLDSLRGVTAKSETSSPTALKKIPVIGDAEIYKNKEVAIYRDEFRKHSNKMKDDTTEIELVYVPGGCFMMGSPETEEDSGADEDPVHKVCVDSFWMGQYEVTQGQWERVMGANPSEFKKGGNYPLESVSWDDVQDFIRKLNSRSSKNYRLPTEAEWEYACRANGSGKYCGGDDLDAVAWHDGNSGKSTHAVGGKDANAFGLHDMSGNVWEWCADWYDGGYYASSPQNNPVGPESGSYRVIRGGSWSDSLKLVRALDRRRYALGYHSYSLGFRLVLPGQQGQAGR